MKKATLATLVLGALCNALPLGEIVSDNRKKDDRMLAYATYTANFEGRRDKTYDPNPRDNIDEPTIGVGHYLLRGDSREVFAKALPEVNFDRVMDKKEKLSEEQIDRLFAYDLPVYVKRAKSAVPAFDNLPVYVQTALVDMAYRGDLKGSPKTLSLINKGEWENASKEYLNSREYRKAVVNGEPGIRPRMESNSERLRQYGVELESRR